jgi:uncharacterized protein (TIGR02145 family)
MDIWICSRMAMQIGNQCWLKENLNVGTMINGVENMTNNSIIEKYCYDDDPTNCDTYGGLYQWDEVMDYVTTEGTQGICPDDWHIPSDVEWTLLTDFLGGESVTGGKMKEVGTTHWNSPNTDATNESGFTALPSGERGSNNGAFYSIGNAAPIWSSTEYDSTYAWTRNLGNTNSFIYAYEENEQFGLALRCLRD